MKKIGITVDNYKLKKFEEELKAKGFTEVEKIPFNSEATLIRITVKEEEFVADTETIRRLCVRLEHHFRRSN